MPIDATLTVLSKCLAYSDTSSQSNPKLRHFDWARSTESVAVRNPRNVPLTVEPQEEVTVFNGVRSTSIDGTTQMTLSLSPLSSSRYRLSWDGVGTAPAFRTDRGLALSGTTVGIVVNPNATVTATSLTGGFAGVLAGDALFIPGPTTGDSATPFSPLNEGLWTVMTASSTDLVMRRPTGTDFVGVAESVSVLSDLSMQAFSAAGVQIGDELDITAGFVASTRNTYEIVAVTPEWVEFTYTAPLAVESNVVVTATGVSVYSAAVRWARIESDQECAIRLNGDTGSYVRVSPCQGTPGWFEKFGTVYSLKIVNLSGNTASVIVFSAE